MTFSVIARRLGTEVAPLCNTALRSSNRVSGRAFSSTSTKNEFDLFDVNAFEKSRQKTKFAGQRFGMSQPNDIYSDRINALESTIELQKKEIQNLTKSFEDYKKNNSGEKEVTCQIGMSSLLLVFWGIYVYDHHIKNV